jgi:hypothetical protein
MEAIKNTVINVMQELGAKKREHAKADPVSLLKKALTKKELQHIKFNYLKKGVLDLYVDSSGWLYNFNLKKEELLNSLNKKSSAIKKIRFRLG